MKPEIQKIKLMIKKSEKKLKEFDLIVEADEEISPLILKWYSRTRGQINLFNKRINFVEKIMTQEYVSKKTQKEAVEFLKECIQESQPFLEDVFTAEDIYTMGRLFDRSGMDAVNRWRSKKYVSKKLE